MNEKEFTPELGQFLNGQQHKEFECSGLLIAALREIATDLTRLEDVDGNYANPFENSGASFSCDAFKVEAYNWNEDVDQLWNFKWRDFEVSWYKWLGRGTSCNREIKPDEIAVMLDECCNALSEIHKQRMKDKGLPF